MGSAGIGATGGLQPAVAEFCFAHDELVVVPIESLSPRGLSAGFRGLLAACSDLGPSWCDGFDDAFALYWTRTRELSERAPESWLPPRRQHVCVVTDPERVRPFYRPLRGASWLVYAADFDPECSDPAFGAYVLVHTERMGSCERPADAFLANLAWWLRAPEPEVARFRAAAHRVERPGAASFRELADALPWLCELGPPSPGPAAGVPAEGTSILAGRGQLVAGEGRERLGELELRLRESVEETIAGHRRRSLASPTAADRLCGWLRERAPDVLLTDGERIVWDPTEPELSGELKEALGAVTEEGVSSVQADLELIDRRSQAFLACLRGPADLPMPDVGKPPDGFVHLHARRRRMAYGLHEPGLRRLVEAAPPYERLLLGARTLHEWGLWVADASWVGLRPERHEVHDRHRDELAAAFDAVVEGAPPSAARACETLIGECRPDESQGGALLRLVEGRVPDHLANLVALPLLSPAEREAHLRASVGCLAGELPPRPSFERLALGLHGLQCLRLAAIADPLDAFLGTTWLAEVYLEPGILDGATFARLIAAVNAYYDDFGIDPAHFGEPLTGEDARSLGQAVRGVA